MPYLPIVIVISTMSLAWFSHGIDGAGPWRDELVTLALSTRSIGQIVDVVQYQDLVHFLYYSCARGASVFSQAAGFDQLVAVRMISAIAMAITTILLYLVCAELGSRSAGVISGLLLLVSSSASRLAQEARGYAVATVMVTAITLAFVRAVGPGGDQGESKIVRRWRMDSWGWYFMLCVAAAFVHLFTLLIVLPHFVFIVLRRRWVLRSWGLTVGLLLAAISPFALLASQQVSQISWLRRPEWHDLLGLFREFSLSVWPLALVSILVGVAVPISRRFRADPLSDLFVLSLASAVMPALLLWSVSFVMPQPMWSARYVMYGLPGALMLHAGCISFLSQRVSLSWRYVVVPVACAITLACLAVAAAPSQVAMRRPDGHGENMREAVRYLSSHSAKGDGVLFVPSYMRFLTEVYPRDFVGLNDVALAHSGAASGTIAGLEKSPDQIGASVAGVANCVWLVEVPNGLSRSQAAADVTKGVALEANFTERQTADLTGVSVSQWCHGPSASP